MLNGRDKEKKSNERNAQYSIKTNDILEPPIHWLHIHIEVDFSHLRFIWPSNPIISLQGMLFFTWESFNYASNRKWYIFHATNVLQNRNTIKLYCVRSPPQIKMHKIIAFIMDFRFCCCSPFFDGQDEAYNSWGIYSNIRITYCRVPAISSTMHRFFHNAHSFIMI